MYKIRFAEINILDDEKENLKRFYYKFEVRSKMQQILSFVKASQIDSKPKIYLPEFNEIMFIHSLKQIQQIQLKKSKMKTTNVKKPQMQLQIQAFKQFNVLDGINFCVKPEMNETKGKEEETQVGSNSEEFSLFLKEKIKLDISQIKKQEEISDISLYKISQFIQEQKKHSEKSHQKSAKIPTSHQISTKYQKSPLLINPSTTGIKRNLLISNNNQNSKKISSSKKKLNTDYKNSEIQEIPSFPMVITPLAFRDNKITLTDRESQEKTPRKLVKSTNQSPNTVYNRFFVTEKYNGNLGKTIEQNLQRHKNMRSDCGGEKTVKVKQEKNNDFDEYMMLTERKKTQEEQNHDQRLGKSNFCFLKLLKTMEFV